MASNAEREKNQRVVEPGYLGIRSDAIESWLMRVHHITLGALTMSWLVTLIIGGIVGWLASIIMKTNAQMGIVANVIVGIVGSLLGFWIAGMAGVPQDGAMRWVASVLGAMLLIFILGKTGMLKRA